MTDPSTDQNRVLSEVDARRVLERAIQLDSARLGATTVADLSHVAEELNISSAALAAALSELDRKEMVAPVAPPVTPEPASRKSWWRPLAIAAAAFTLGAVSGASSNDPGPSILLSLLASAILVARHRREKSPGEFQTDILALYLALGLGWLAGEGGGREEIVYGVGFCFLLSTAVGGFLVRLKNPFSKPVPTTPSETQ